MFSKKSLDKGFRKTSVLLAFHTSLRSVEKRREKKIYIYIYCSIWKTRGRRSFAFRKHSCSTKKLSSPYNGISSTLIMVYTNFFPSSLAFSYRLSPLSKYVTNSPILYNEQLEWYGFLFFFNSIKRCINYFFFLIMFRIYLIEQNLLFFALKS